jgi:molybdopterin synthase sulfur carrier subunit
VTVTLRLFAAAREAAGRGHDEFDTSGAPTVDALLEAATAAYGSTFADVLARSRVWVNGDDPSDGRAPRRADGDAGAVRPPVSGGIACPGRLGS